MYFTCTSTIMNSMFKITLLVIFVCFLTFAQAAKGKGGKQKESKKQPDDSEAPEIPAGETIGVPFDIKVYPYDSSENINNTLLHLYPGAKPIKLAVSGVYLKCDFEKSCCYRNGHPPEDELEWVLAEGTVSPQLMKTVLGTSEVPDGRFLVVGNTNVNAASPNDKALFIACTLECTQEKIKVSLRHWARNAKIEVCLQDDLDKSGALKNCQELPNDSQPGPTEVSLPPHPNANIVIKAGSFGKLAVALIDDITVTSIKCPPSTTPRPTTTPAPTTTTTTKKPTTTTTLPPETPPAFSDAVCPAILCSFEGTTCNYYNSVGPAAKSGKWKLDGSSSQGESSGIGMAGEGRSFIATRLKPGETASLETAADFYEQKTVKFLVFKSADKVDLQACCGSVDNCPYSSQQTSQQNQWTHGQFSCPQGAKKVIFLAKNSGNNEGSVGLDATHLLMGNENGEIACYQ